MPSVLRYSFKYTTLFIPDCKISLEQSKQGLSVKYKVECRPLICGSMNEQPFWYEKYGKEYLPNSQKVHEKGLYLPNHHDITEEEVKFICDILNNSI